jgi:hypothetical protein
MMPLRWGMVVSLLLVALAAVCAPAHAVNE